MHSQSTIMKPCLRERKPCLKYKFYDEYESDESDPNAEPDKSEDEEISYCHDCDIVFEDEQRLHKHLLKHVKLPILQLEKLNILEERAPIKLTLKGCESGEFAVVNSPLSERDFSSPQLYAEPSQPLPRLSDFRRAVKTLGQASDKTDDDYEEKYIIPDSDPVAGGGGGTCGADIGTTVPPTRTPKTEPEGYVEEEEEIEEENVTNVSFSPNYVGEGMLHHDENSRESQLSSNKTTSDGGYGSSIPGAEPTPPPEPCPTPDHLMPKIRIKSSGLLMAPERESPQGLTITEITDGDEGSSMEQDPFAGVESWTPGGAASGNSMEDPLRLPDSIESDGNIISNLFTNNTDRAKDLGLTSSDSEFLDGLGSDGNRGNNNNNSAMAVYNPNVAATTTSTTQSLLPASVSTALAGLPMQQLAQQVSRMQQQPGQQMHQQNVLINIQQFPQQPQQPQQQQVQPYGMYHHPYQGAAYGQQAYGHPHHQAAYGQPYAQPNLYYAAPPPAYSTAPAQHMPPPPAPHQQQPQPTQAYIIQPAQQQQPPIVLGAVSQLTPAQGAQAYGQQQVHYGAAAVGAQQQQQQQQQQPGQQGQQYNQGQQPQILNTQAHLQQQPQQPQQVGANRMPAPRAPGQVGGPRMVGGQRGPSMVGTRGSYSPRGGAAGARPIMNRGRGGPGQMMSMRGRPRAPMNVQQNGIRSPLQGTSPVKRTPEQTSALAAKRRRMESAQTTIKVEQDDDDDDCEVVSVQQKTETAKLPKIQSVQGAVADPETAPSGVMHLSDSITLSIRQPPPRPPSPKAQSDAKQVANVLAARGITVTAAPKETKDSPVPINMNNAVRLGPNKIGKKDDHTPTVDLTDDVRVPAPKTLPSPSTNGQAAPSTTNTIPPPQPFKCDQCPARYGTNIALVKHRQIAHKTCNQMDYGVPLIDLRQPGIMSKLTNFGIYNYIPLPAANVSGMFALPVISMNAVKNNVNLSALGSSMLSLGPIRKIQKSGPGASGAPNTTQQSPPRGRPPSNPTTPTKQQ